MFLPGCSVDWVCFFSITSPAWEISVHGDFREEGPSLGKPVLVMREKTERPEAVEGTVNRGGDRDLFLGSISQA